MFVLGKNGNQYMIQIEPIINKITLENKLYYLVGDFNINILKDEEKYIDDFINLMYSYSLYPQILRPTRITNKSETLIDNIFTNDTKNTNVSGIIMLDTSDHLPNFTLTDTAINAVKIQRPKYSRDFSGTNINKLNSCMSKINWKEVLNKHVNDVNVMYNKFMEIFNLMLDKYTPLKRKKCRSKTKPTHPWITKDLIKLINKKSKLYKQYMTKKTLVNRTKYKTLNNKVNKLLKSAKKNIFQKSIG